jgi:hypothetical protein
MTRRIALLTAMLCLALPAATAAADWQTDRAQAVAAKVWDDPCDGQVILQLAEPPQPSWRAWSYPRLCTVVLSTAARWRWSELCPAMIHEYGHLAGFRDPENTADPFHSTDPHSIMWPFLHGDARCAQKGEIFLGLAPAAVQSRAEQPRTCRRKAHRRACSRVSRAGALR